MEFKIALDVFAGPMDLLLYLVKRHEVDITQVPLAKVTEDFVAYLDVLEDLAIDQVGEFVELASVLLEIKARELVPRPEETEEVVEPVREELVKRLLEYKQYRDAAVVLEDRARVSALGKLGLFARATLAGIMPPATTGNATNLDDAALQSLATARDLLLQHGVSA